MAYNSKTPYPKPQRIAELIDYDPATGALTWKPRKPSDFTSPNCGHDGTKQAAHFNATEAGQPCFTTVSAKGYLKGTVERRYLRAHSVAFVIYHGRWPYDEIDHINGDKQDNRIVNLRDVTHATNMANPATPPVQKPRKEFDHEPALKYNVELEFWSVEQACEALNIAQPTLYKWIKQGKVERVKFGSLNRIHRDELDRLVREATP